MQTCSRGGKRHAGGVAAVGELALPLEQAMGLGDVGIHEQAGAAHHAQTAT